MSERIVERDDKGREIVFVNRIPIHLRECHINNWLNVDMYKSDGRRETMNLGIEPSVVTLTSHQRIRLEDVSSDDVTKVMLKMGYPWKLRTVL